MMDRGDVVNDQWHLVNNNCIPRTVHSVFFLSLYLQEETIGGEEAIRWEFCARRIHSLHELLDGLIWRRRSGHYR